MKNDINCKNEVWKPVVGYEDLYEVSSFGRVKSLNYNRTGKEKIRKPLKTKYGYLQVNLCKDGKPKNFKVHRLVAENFIPNPLNLPQINHKDENKENNFVENLEFCDAQYNTNYGTRNERIVLKNINHPSKSKRVYQFSLSGNFIRGWKSTMEIEHELGYNHGHIVKCCHGKRKSAYKFIWSYNKPLQ